MTKPPLLKGFYTSSLGGMLVIRDNNALFSFVEGHKNAPYLLIDTEFLREQTYYPKLCLIQLAGPEDAAIVDVLAEGLEFDLLRPLLADEAIVKVFHAGRQDLEIFLNLYGFVPHPLFDTQVAAMVCGHGEQVAFDTLVRRIAGISLDKMSRFTDWARRPLSERQLDYALADVVHLRPVYLALAAKLKTLGREHWIESDLATLGDPGLYRIDPDRAWERLKVRSRDPAFLGRLQALAAWREREAQSRDLPRQHLLKDEQLQEIAANNPANAGQLSYARGISPQTAKGKLGQRILAALAEAQPLAVPRPPRRPESVSSANSGARSDLLRVLLRMAAERHGVAARLIASSSEVERLANCERDGLEVLIGWRAEVFGNDALALLDGRLALCSTKDEVKVLRQQDDGSWQERPAAGDLRPTRSDLRGSGEGPPRQTPPGRPGS
ncbi:MAG: ribonuclease D [Rhodospirillales bacterium]|nr:ribonuclease D [Rhodospirillales bacterium]